MVLVLVLGVVPRGLKQELLRAWGLEVLKVLQLLPLGPEEVVFRKVFLMEIHIEYGTLLLG
jgi:hypothetical protein